MATVNPEGNSGSLTLEEAAAAYATPETEEETGDGQAEAEQDAGEDVEAATEAADEPDDEGQVEEERQEQPAYAEAQAKVRLPDGSEATVADLIQGNLRDRDYRQKTMEAAERSRAVEAKVQQVQQLEQQITGDREFMAQLIQAIMPPKPDANLAAADFIEYGIQKARHDSFAEQVNYLLSQNQQSQQRRQAEQQENLQQIKAREWQATLTEMPELKDSTKLQAFVSDVQVHGAHYKFTPQELANISLDHRQAVVLRDAIAWRKLQASKAKVVQKVENRPPVQRGSARQSPEAQRGREARVAMDRLTASGSLRDGVAALIALEKG